MVLFDDGSIYGTGSNTNGQLGLGDTSNRNTFTEITNIPAGKTATSISCGFFHTMVLFDDGSIYGTGLNSYGALGLGDNTQRITLTEITNIPAGKRATSIYCGFFHTMVLFDDGSIYVTGYNNNGQLGLGDTSSKNTLTEITNMPVGKTATSISCGNSHTMVLFDDESIYLTGYNGHGELSFGDNTNRNILTQFINIQDVIYVQDMVSIPRPISNAIPIPNICFLAGTPIKTDQGNIPIEKINHNIHTIRNKKIVGITQTITQDKYLICFEKNSLDKNIPSQQTIITQNHCIFYKGKMVQVKKFLGINSKVYEINYNSEILYNVLMKEHDKMLVNNLIFETFTS
jgi:CheY-specific phosphatase CheX